MSFDARSQQLGLLVGATQMGAGAAGAAPAPKKAQDPTLSLRGVTKTYGRTTAVSEMCLDIQPGEMVGIAGHNGAGKTTLMKIIGGIATRDRGDVRVGGENLPLHYSPGFARERGIGLALQEISLFPELRVLEHHGAKDARRVRPGWRTRSAAAVQRQLDAMFPSHGISPYALVQQLSLAQRQMLQIALAAMHEEPLRLLILDEPTSSLTEDLSRQLFEYLHRARNDEGLAIILVSHKMGDILTHTDRTVVMRDGRLVSDSPSQSLSLQQVMKDMGASTEVAAATLRPHEVHATASSDPDTVEISGLAWRGLQHVSLRVGKGEIVGLAGLEANGQREILEAVWAGRRWTAPQRVRRAVHVRGHATYVSGDRQDQGIFPLWDVEENLFVGSLSQVSRFGLVHRATARQYCADWIDRLAIKANPSTPITALSGGNQQKVLLARGLGPAPDLLILDDPFRGVDVTTKTDAYQRLREFAATGASVLWYTSENAELLECDRVYVMRGHAVSAELTREELTAEALILKSFDDVAEEA